MRPTPCASRYITRPWRRRWLLKPEFTDKNALALPIPSIHRNSVRQEIVWPKRYCVRRGFHAVNTKPKSKSKPRSIMGQYEREKALYPGCVLLFRMGDFFEIFYDDAKIVSNILGIVLTQRKKKSANREEAIPMCGVPHHSLHKYLGQLITAGLRVAICDQVEKHPARWKNEKARTSLLKREVVQVITPGTILEDDILLPYEHNFLVSMAADCKSGANITETDEFGLAQLDISTGELWVSPSNLQGLKNSLTRFAPSELIVADGLATAFLGHLFERKTENIYEFSNDDTTCVEYECSTALLNKNCTVTLRNDDAFSIVQKSLHLDLADLNSSFPKDSPDRFTRAELLALGGLLDYVRFTQCGKMPRINSPQRLDFMSNTAHIQPTRRSVNTASLEDGSTRSGEYLRNEYMEIDSAAIKSLELVETIRGQRKGSLLDAVIRTCTPGGSRLLFDRLQLPLLDINSINRRLDTVEFFYQSHSARALVKTHLNQCGDPQRCLQRVAMNSAGPRDLWKIAVTLQHARCLAQGLRNMFNENKEPLRLYSNGTERLITEDSELFECIRNIDGNSDLVDIEEKLLKALVGSETNDENTTKQGSTVIDSNMEADSYMVEVQVRKEDGGFIKRGYDEILDNLKDSSRVSRKDVKELEKQYRLMTSIDLLKIKGSKNKNVGYVVEIPKRHQETLDPSFFFKLNETANTARFKTADLTKLEVGLYTDDEKILEREMELFGELCKIISSSSVDISAVADAMAKLDVALGFALLAKEKGFVRPILDHSNVFDIDHGRHIVVEKNGYFVSNHLRLGLVDEAYDVASSRVHGADNNSNFCESSAWMITGPNMGGKSTFLRQNAHIAILAQMGSFVPASRARLGIVDKVFCRVGASDELAADRSTFMVEMEETAIILNNATPRSLVIVDEVGRGTSTRDGRAIAQAVLENLLDVGCRTLFATHFHELTDMAKSHPNLHLYTLAISETEASDENEEEARKDHTKPNLAFLYTIRPGISSESYGVHVAGLAGVPPSVVKRAQDLVFEDKQSSQ